jgi:hypothetical protein
LIFKFDDRSLEHVIQKELSCRVAAPAHDENVAQASCLHERRLPRKAGRYIFVVILLSAGNALQN